MSGTRTFTARWIFPVSGPPLERGTVSIRGDRIESVQPRGECTADVDLGNVAIVPGLVNLHTHLDLSGARGLIPPTDPDHFTDWLRGVIAYRRGRSAEQVQEDIRAGLAESLRFGTTLIGDIAAEGASWDTVSVAKTRAVVFLELIGLKAERFAEISRQYRMWKDSKSNSVLCRKGTSPHAPYSTQFEVMVGGQRDDIVMTHLAESPGEVELLRDQTGPFVEFLQSLGVWEPTAFRRLERYLTRSRFIDTYLFAHANYLPLDCCKYIAGLHTIVYCPRTHAAFRHPPHPFREFLQRGVRVCLGTDSLASNPDLDILAEARFVHEKYPDFPGDQLLRMITLSGAEALGWANEAGSLEPGKSADFVGIPLPNADGDPHELLFASQSEPDAQARGESPPSLARRANNEERRTMFRGEWREPA